MHRSTFHMIVAASMAISPAKHSSAQGESGPTLGIYLPSMISEVELNLAAEMVRMSDAQLEHARSSHEAYANTWNKHLSGSLDLLKSACREASREFFESRDPATRVATFKRLNDVENSLSRDLMSAEQHFLVRLEEVLSDEQRLRMNTVRSRRMLTARRIAHHAGVLGAASQDLIEQMRRLGVEPHDYDSLPQIVEEYVLAIGPPCERLDRRFLETRDRIMALECDMTFLQKTDPAASESAFDQRTSLMSETAGVERHVADINLRFAERFAAALPDPLNQRFRDVFRTRSFCQVFPDEQEPRFMIRAFIADDALTDEQRETIKVVINANRERYEAVCKSLEQRHLDYYQYYAGVRRDDRAAEFHRDMLSLKRNRLELNKDLVQQVAAMLPDEVRAKHDAAIREWQHANR